MMSASVSVSSEPVDHRDDAFAEIGMRYADDGRLGDACQRIDLLFDFLRIDVETAADDQVVLATDDRNDARASDIVTTSPVMK